jgi:hypothetical protein
VKGLTTEDTEGTEVLDKPKQALRYLVYQVGCIECGVSSYPIKWVESLDEAITIAKAHPDTWVSEGGDGYITVIDLANCKEVAVKRKDRFWLDSKEGGK